MCLTQAATVIVLGVDAQSTTRRPSCHEPFLGNSGYLVRRQAKKVCSTQVSSEPNLYLHYPRVASASTELEKEPDISKGWNLTNGHGVIHMSLTQTPLNKANDTTPRVLLCLNHSRVLIWPMLCSRKSLWVGTWLRQSQQNA